MNKEYILNRVKPYLNANGMLKEDDFNKLFSKLSLHQQYKIINILIEFNIEIEYEDEFENDDKPYKNGDNGVFYNIDKVNNLSNEHLCVLYQQGNKAALDLLVSKNLKLVKSRVSKYIKKYKHKLEEDDLIQYGIIGLIKCAEKFDIKKYNRFSTYAVWWIDQSIFRNIVDYGFTIRIPARCFEQVNKLNKILIKYPDYTKEQIYEILKEEGFTKKKFEEILFIAENIISPASLNYVREQEESELGEFIKDKMNLSPEEQVEKIILKETIKSLLGTLSKRERDILELRYGFKNGFRKTLEQIGSMYGVTRERIRQIEKKALKKLQKQCKDKNISDFL